MRDNINTVGFLVLFLFFKLYPHVNGLVVKFFIFFPSFSFTSSKHKYDLPSCQLKCYLEKLLFLNLQKVCCSLMTCKDLLMSILWSDSNAQRCAKSKFIFGQVLIKRFSCLELGPCETCKNPVFLSALMDMS